MGTGSGELKGKDTIILRLTPDYRPQAAICRYAPLTKTPSAAQTPSEGKDREGKKKPTEKIEEDFSGKKR